MRVLILDTFPADAVRELRDSALSVDYRPGLRAEDAKSIISGFQILICNLVRLPPQVFDEAAALEMVVDIGHQCCGTRARGAVTCRAGSFAESAYAELALGQILACDRCIVQNTDHLRRGEWRQKFFTRRGGLRGRCLGLIGTGYGAQELMRVVRDMGVRVLIWERSPAQRALFPADAEYVDDLNDIARRCDIVSVHTDNFSGRNHHLISGAFFSEMKSEAIFVNVSCASVVDTTELMNAIDEKDLSVGVDVYDSEPLSTVGDFSHTDLAEAASCATSHIGPFTKQTSLLTAQEAVRTVLAYFQRGEVINQIT